ncbi:uncharacterized protein LOC134531892 isoform X2 [Bacillus rossius redtenbacheri]|uniref:uncharacterized protein LOC134531892 isoform X2 n=1 Tax=Bacillus rossius redtenbacheri TaxID=93214 RepID=UPI002FDEF624
MSECRICASTDAIFLNIFQKNDKRKYDAEINTCLPIKVTNDDVISLKICHVCVHKLELCNTFVCRFLATEPQRQMGSGQNVCYLCLGNDGVLSNLFDGNWIHQIETALGCKVHRGKKVPSKICHHCAYKLGELFNLFQSALDSESKLYMMCEKSVVKINQQPKLTKSPGSPNKKSLSIDITSMTGKAIVRVSARKFKPTEVSSVVPAGVGANLNAKALKVTVSKLPDISVQDQPHRQLGSNDIAATGNMMMSRDKLTEISHQILESRTSKKVSAVPKMPESKQKTTNKDVDSNVKLKKGETTSEKMADGRSKRKKENEESDSNNSKKVRSDAKKPAVKRRDSISLVGHVYDIRRTKRKRTITDYNQFLNDGLLLSPRGDRGKKDVKPVQKAMLPKEATKTASPRKQSPTAVPSRRGSQKFTDGKLEDQENLPRKRSPQKVISLESSELKDADEQVAKSKSTSPKSEKNSKSPRKRKVQEEDVGGDTADEPAPTETLNKYECSVCGEQYSSTVEGKGHELAHTARSLQLIMYRWGADSRSSHQNSPSKGSKKSNAKTENVKNNGKPNTETEVVTKEISKVLQDVVSLVSESSPSKQQNVNGSTVTRTRRGRIVVSKLQIAKPRGRRANAKADALKREETVRSIISDFESLEEGEEDEKETSPSTVENSDAPGADRGAKEKVSEQGPEQSRVGPETVKNGFADKEVDRRAEDLAPESRDGERDEGDPGPRETAAQLTEEAGEGSGESSVPSGEAPGTGDRGGSTGDELISGANEDTDAGSRDKDGGKGPDEAPTEADEVRPRARVEDVIDVEEKSGRSSGGSSVILEETQPSVGLGESGYDLHTSLEKEIYELHGVENLDFTPPKSSGLEPLTSSEASASTKVSPVNNDTDLIHILE